MDTLTQKIILQFASLCGIDIPTAAGYSQLIDSSIAEASSMLKDGVEAAEHEFELTHLCAAFCCCKYTLQKLLNQPDTIRAGDISVSNNSGRSIENARHIKDEAIFSARSILKDDSFYFGRTK